MSNQLRQSACINSKVRYNFVQVQCIFGSVHKLSLGVQDVVISQKGIDNH